MARYTGPVCRLCRREGAKLYLKGDRCLTPKCAFEKRGKEAVKPGIHGADRKKLTPYAIQLREKQKAKRIYGLQEKQFHQYYEKAEKLRGVTGHNMLILLERRLDNIVYQLKLGESRAEARQMVNHGLITVNGKTVDIASYLIKVGDVIAVKESKLDRVCFARQKGEAKHNLPKWIEFNAETLSGKILELPKREEIAANIKESMIIELYSK
jgi:small subunit ribosomal protein S4